jgi:hypothetical protein
MIGKTMLRPMDIWRCAILRQDVPGILQNGIDTESLVWLPEMPPDHFRADPFGLWRCGRLHVFAEAFDYRDRLGHIDALVYDDALKLLDCRPVLKKPWHLSYPFVFEAEGETWMLPEAYKSGTLTLYRARDFPFVWEPVCDLPLDGPAIDATPVFFDGTWWLFYTPSHSKTARLSHLHVAWANQLTGPWHVHPGNPVRIDLTGARPGGVPWVNANTLVLPVQDCARTYGAAIVPLRIDRLDEQGFAATKLPRLTAPSAMAPFTDGLHTLAAVGSLTLIDVKRMDVSLSAKLRRLSGIIRRPPHRT